jgi:hypothetical protein
MSGIIEKCVPFKYQTFFCSIWTREDVSEWIEEFENTKWDFVEPRSMKKEYSEEDSDE